MKAPVFLGVPGRDAFSQTGKAVYHPRFAATNQADGVSPVFGKPGPIAFRVLDGPDRDRNGRTMISS